MRVGVSDRSFGRSSKASGRMQEESKEHKASVIRDAEPRAEIQAGIFARRSGDRLEKPWTSAAGKDRGPNPAWNLAEVGRLV